MALKVVIDTNVWISALINPHGYPAKLRESFEEGLFQCIVSAPMLEELIDVINMSSFLNHHNIDVTTIADFLEILKTK